MLQSRSQSHLVPETCFSCSSMMFPTQSRMRMALRRLQVARTSQGGWQRHLPVEVAAVRLLNGALPSEMLQSLLRLELWQLPLRSMPDLRWTASPVDAAGVRQGRASEHGCQPCTGQR